MASPGAASIVSQFFSFPLGNGRRGRCRRHGDGQGRPMGEPSLARRLGLPRQRTIMTVRHRTSIEASVSIAFAKTYAGPHFPAWTAADRPDTGAAFPRRHLALLVVGSPGAPDPRREGNMTDQVRVHGRRLRVHDGRRVPHRHGGRGGSSAPSSRHSDAGVIASRRARRVRAWSRGDDRDRPSRGEGQRRGRITHVPSRGW